MDVKSFPSGYTDITTSATKILAAKVDGTTGYKTQRAGGDNFADVVSRGNSASDISITGTAAFESSAAGLPAVSLRGAAPFIGWYGTSGTPRKGYMQHSGGELAIINDDAGGVRIGNNLTVNGSVSGTVFNPTSLRERKRDIFDYDQDALYHINQLKLHTYHFREYKLVEKTPDIYEDVINEDGVVQKMLLTPATYQQEEITPVAQMLNVGVIIDEVDNDLIADQERGCLNLNNIVFLLAKSVQQLTARIEALEAK